MRVEKYSASGNDFVIFDSDTNEDRSELAKELCHRQNGVGADGLVVIVPHKDYDFAWEFYNSDGSHADMCGNASRATAHYAYHHKLASESMSFLTGAGVINATIIDGNNRRGSVLSELTPPNILEKEIIFNGKSWWKINTGVPHLVNLTNNINEFNIDELRELRYKYNANVNIAFVDENKNMKVRTYERGVEDETLACGTGMAACYYRALQENLVEGNIEVYPKSGETLYLGMNEKTITFQGEVKNTFSAEL